MSTIEEQARALLNPVLGECVRQRTAAGVAKYGQTLDENKQEDRAKAVHLVQELMDAVQYALWLGVPGGRQAARHCAFWACQVQEGYALTTEEIMTGGKQ